MEVVVSTALRRGVLPPQARGMVKRETMQPIAKGNRRAFEASDALRVGQIPVLPPQMSRRDSIPITCAHSGNFEARSVIAKDA